MAVTCATCNAYQRYPGQPRGVCRDRPPVPLLVQVSQDEEGHLRPGVISWFPEVHETDWCRRHEPKGPEAMEPVDLEVLPPEGSA